MKTLLWYLLAFIRQAFIKRKGKSLVAYLVDPQYRKDIDKVREHVGFGGKMESTCIPLGLLESAHKVHYWDWVYKLINRIHKGERIDKTNPLMVSHNSSTGKYLVIDGNHRYSAIVRSKRYTPDTLIYVQLYRKKA